MYNTITEKIKNGRLYWKGLKSGSKKALDFRKAIKDQLMSRGRRLYRPGRKRETMLKTNSKKAAENIRQYIMDNFTPESYTENPPETFPAIASLILETVEAEKSHNAYINDAEMFEDWAQGLPGMLNTCYYYNRSAVEDLGNILEETESEKARFTEAQAEKLLTNLIYRQLVKGAKK